MNRMENEAKSEKCVDITDDNLTVQMKSAGSLGASCLCYCAEEGSVLTPTSWTGEGRYVREPKARAATLARRC